MAVRIRWFSGTGNSRCVAERLARKLDADTVDVQSIVQAAPTVPGDTARLVLAFPVYAFGLPGLVARYAQSLSIPETVPVYSLATYAGLAGGPHHELRRILRRNGADLWGGWTVKMPENYPVMKPPPPEEQQRQLFHEADRRVDALCSTIRDGERAGLEDSPVPISWLAPPVHALALAKFRTMDAKFHVHEHCTACGTCEKVCPVGNIHFEGNRPAWNHRCEQCFACLQWCPVDAIEWGERTQNKPRYHHPDYSATDFFAR